jgi:predicted phosphoadenosine phosphosulfate sulfurtransferase
MAKIHKKQSTEESCYDLAVRRTKYAFDNFDKVVISFSGGKDSTACLNLALEEARRRDRLPLDVVFFDEETIPPETVEYVQRVAAMPGVNLMWFCLPFHLGNACSRESPEWYIWDEADREKWVRPLPEQAITQWPTFRRGMGLADFSRTLFGPECGQVAWILGIRTQESMTRFRTIATKSGFDCFSVMCEISTEYAETIGLKRQKSPNKMPWAYKLYPIYDWTVEDIWTATHKFGWDYNRVYDVMRACGVPPGLARCSPTFGEQTNRGLWKYKVCWPDLWAKMCYRVPGAATAARYANTELYGVGVKPSTISEGESWQERTMALVGQLEGVAKRDVSKGILQMLKTHRNFYLKRDRRPTALPDAEPDQLSGFSWQVLYGIAAAGGDKFGRQSQKASKKAILNRIKREKES